VSSWTPSAFRLYRKRLARIALRTDAPSSRFTVWNAKPSQFILRFDAALN